MGVKFDCWIDVSSLFFSGFVVCLVLLLCFGFWLRYLCFLSCNKLVAARKQMSILQAPNVLVIQLKVSLSYFLISFCYMLLKLLYPSIFCVYLFILTVLLLFSVGRDLRVYLAGRLKNLFHLRRFWCSQASCAKQTRYSWDLKLWI